MEEWRPRPVKNPSSSRPLRRACWSLSLTPRISVCWESQCVTQRECYCRVKRVSHRKRTRASRSGGGCNSNYCWLNCVTWNMTASTQRKRHYLKIFLNTLFTWPDWESESSWEKVEQGAVMLVSNSRGRLAQAISGPYNIKVSLWAMFSWKRDHHSAPDVLP